jgi:hypothetical protein
MTRRTTWTVGLRNERKRRNKPTFWSKNPGPSSRPWALLPLELIIPTQRTRHPYLRPVLEATDPVSAEVATYNKEKFGLLDLFPF